MGEIMERMYNIIIRMINHDALVAGFWFMKSLFWGNIIAFLCLFILKKSHVNFNYGIMFALLFVLSLIFVLDSYKRTLTFLYIGPQQLLSAFFILIGYLFSYFKIKKMNLFFSLVSFMLIFIGSFKWKMSTNLLTFDNIRVVPYIVSASLFVWSIYSFNWNVVNKSVLRLLDYMGKNTLQILIWHFSCFKIVSLIIVVIYELPFSRLKEFLFLVDYSLNGWCFAYFIFGITIPLLINRAISLFLQHGK